MPFSKTTWVKFGMLGLSVLWWVAESTIEYLLTEGRAPAYLGFFAEFFRSSSIQD